MFPIMVLYKLLVYLMLVISVPLWVLAWLFSEKRRASLLQRFGFRTGFSQPESSPAKIIWVHALSVGEVISVLPLVQALKKRFSDISITFTASTRSGFETAREKLTCENSRLVDQLGYFPLDIGCSIRRVCNTLQPTAVILVETDLWPNFLYEMKTADIPVILVNARLSKRALKGYGFFRPFFSWLFSLPERILVQSALDRDRFVLLGVNPDRVVVTGNMKFDQPYPRMTQMDIQNLKQQLSLDSKARIIIAGSTHEGEEILICKAYGNLKSEFPGLVLIVAPRDPGRCKPLKSTLSREKYRVSAMSDLKHHAAASDIILVDTMGVLAKLYAICDAAFIGGSLVKSGGHNPLEPAVFSKPVCFGPDMSDFLEIADLLIAGNGSRQVASVKDLEQFFHRILADEQLCRYMGQQNFSVVSAHCGAVDQIIDQMEQVKIV